MLVLESPTQRDDDPKGVTCRAISATLQNIVGTALGLPIVSLLQTPNPNLTGLEFSATNARAFTAVALSLAVGKPT